MKTFSSKLLFLSNFKSLWGLFVTKIYNILLSKMIEIVQEWCQECFSIIYRFKLHNFEVIRLFESCLLCNFFITDKYIWSLIVLALWLSSKVHQITNQLPFLKIIIKDLFKHYSFIAPCTTSDNWLKVWGFRDKKIQEIVIKKLVQK